VKKWCGILGIPADVLKEAVKAFWFAGNGHSKTPKRLDGHPKVMTTHRQRLNDRNRPTGQVTAIHAWNDAAGTQW